MRRVGVAVLLVDLENLWHCLIRNPAETKKNPVGLSDVFSGIRKIAATLRNQGKVFTFIFLPPHYRNVAEVAGTDDLLWSFCPTFGAGRTRYNSADENIIRLANLIAQPRNCQSHIQDIFGIGALSFIEVWAERIFQSGKVPIFWPDGGSANKRKHSGKKIRAALKSFLNEKSRITDVCLFSGDSDFQAAVERLQNRGINVIISLLPNDSLSLDLLAKANEFWDFPRETAPH